MIKAVVFDYGNVISESQDTSCYARMSEISGLSEEIITHAFWKYRPDFDRGTIRGEEMYLKLLADSGVTGNDLFLSEMAKKLLSEDIRSWSRVSSTVTEWALSLQKQGFVLGILSNMPVDFLELYEKKIELFYRSDVAVFSCQIKQIKPDREIYETLIGHLGCKPEEIVFFDDIQVNIDGALGAGINAFLWAGLDQAKKDWDTLTKQG